MRTPTTSTGTSTISTVDDPTNYVGAYNSIAIGQDGLPVIGYQDADAGTVKLAKCINVACSGASVINTVDDPPTNYVGSYTAMAIGGDGFPVMSYRDSTAGALKVAKCVSANCSGATIVTTADDPPGTTSGYYTSIAIGQDGFPVISYYDQANQSLRVAKCVNSACTGASNLTTVDDQITNWVGQHTSIAIGNDGLPVISYQDATAGALKVAKCPKPTCAP